MKHFFSTSRPFARTVVTGALLLSLTAVTACTATGAQEGESSSARTVSANDFPVNVTESIHPAANAPTEGDLRVTLLGTGSPIPSTDRFGFSVLVQAGEKNYVIDAGRGAIIRLIQAGVEAGQVDGLFLTHFHSDHVISIDDLWMTGYVPAFGGREGTFNVYGPEGVSNIVDNVRDAFQNDIDVRVADGEVQRDTTGIQAHEFTEDGVIFDQDGLQVTMFDVQHDPANVIKPSKGFRIDYNGKSVLISGDTIPHENVVTYGKDVDLMLHEVAAFQDRNVLPQVISHHTTPDQAGEIFAEAKPKLAVYTHFVNGIPGKVEGITDEEMISRTKENYDGEVVLGEDLMSFLITDDDIEVTDQADLAELAAE
ncbi:MBL fold metallo-hydrolase [Corynebacterium comes]|uniref:Ribonuclease Z n=1 Tax=Corynebacterium comes TaxID=2675218 RepID=A0A6B8W151_9CORY|nr:MBL fold metallo-hydrolase [Corynebacterium comes]QGU03350.1 Ribonuclease Z [Corynebacterium comes]